MFPLFFVVVILYSFFYSFTQVDLGLTLSRNPLIHTVVANIQHIGYFNRQLSTVLFLIMWLLFVAVYLLLIKKALRGQLSRAAVWTMIFFMVLVLSFSYNAFSYDLFNYIFDAKILTHYFQNPYFHKPLDFQSDPMLGFMHWTHRNYPYGPLWLLLSLPFSALGLNLFLPTLFLFKLGISASFIGTLYFIEKIVKKISPGREIVTLTLIAFHPLLIVENIISAHNDSVMMFFVFMALYVFLINKTTLSVVSFVSVCIKFATAFLIPSIGFLLIAQRRKIPQSWNLFLLFSGCMLTLAVIVASHQSTFQPWYLTWPLPFFLLPFNGYAKALQVVGAFSAASLFAYVPFLYSGDWNNAIPSDFFIILWGGIMLFYFAVGTQLLMKKKML